MTGLTGATGSASKNSTWWTENASPNSPTLVSTLQTPSMPALASTVPPTASASRLLTLTPQGEALGFSIDGIGRVLRDRLEGTELFEQLDRPALRPLPAGRPFLGLGFQDDMRAVRDGRWKLIHAEGGFRPMLFDLEADPDELTDLGGRDDHADVIARMYDRLGAWGRRMSQRVTRSDADINAARGQSLRRGILPFLVDGSEVPEDMSRAYRGPAPRDYTKPQSDPPDT